MSEIYTHKLRDLARQAGKELDLTKYLKEGVYAMNGGPSFETVAECKMLQAVGADVVGKERTQVSDGVLTKIPVDYEIMSLGRFSLPERERLNVTSCSHVRCKPQIAHFSDLLTNM